MKTVFSILAAVCCLAASAELQSVTLVPGENAIAGPAEVIAVQAVSETASATFTLKKITRYGRTTVAAATVTNVTYGTAWSNLTHTVTNLMIEAWRVNATGSNFVARALNEQPSYYPWPDIVILTNKVEATEVYTNIPYRVKTGQKIETVRVVRPSGKAVTNSLATGTLSSGYLEQALTNKLVGAGDSIDASGSAVSGGEVRIIVRR